MLYFSGLWMLKYKKSQIAKGQYKDYLVGQLTRCTLYRFQLSKNVFVFFVETFITKKKHLEYLNNSNVN